MKRLAAIALVCACATVPASGPGAPGGAETFFPLTVGNAWSYDADGALVILKVKARDGARVDLGEFAYEVRADGIVRMPPGKYVLQWPATFGREWDLPNGGRARITATDASVSTPAGDYSGCVVVEETDPTGMRTLTTFARGIGPVDVVVTNGSMTSHAKLRGFTRAGEEI